MREVSAALRGMLCDFKLLDVVRSLKRRPRRQQKRVPRKNNRRCGLQRAVETDMILPMC